MNNCLERKAIEAIVIGLIRRRRECYTLPIIRRGGDDVDDSGSGKVAMMMMGGADDNAQELGVDVGWLRGNVV